MKRKDIFKAICLYSWKDVLFSGVLLLTAVSGAGLVLFITAQQGVLGLRDDSLGYLLIAQSFTGQIQATSKAYVSYDSVTWSLTHFPPLFPWILTLWHNVSGQDFLSSGRWLYACLFGLDMVIVGMILRRCLHSYMLAFLGVVWIFFSTDMLELYSVALSEALFIFFIFIWLGYFLDFLNNSKITSFYISFFVIALACMTRLAGFTLLVTSLAGLLVFKKKRLILNC